MNKKGVIGAVFFGILISGLILVLGFTKDINKDYTQTLYSVYLDGKLLGNIENSSELYALINQEQKEIKDRYEVETIYPPKGLEITPVVTYNKDIVSAKEIYNEIKDKETFTIEGYKVTIKKETPITFNLLNKDFLDEAIRSVVETFVGTDNLEKYLEGTQEQVTEEGTTITNIYLSEEISIKKTLISTEEYIFTNVEDLKKYLLFGTVENQKSYSVRLGDTISTVASNNSLSTEEFLIANPEIVSENVLLYPGQKVNIGLISPLVSVVEENTSVEKQKITYETIIEYDKNMAAGNKYKKQNGSNGLSKVTFKNQIVNGEIYHAIRVAIEEITPAVNEIIVMGGSNVVYIGDSTYWAWPTNKPYRISSYRGWRWGRMHNGIDITGTGGQGSPIYSIQNGTVVVSTYGSTQGNYVVIDHHNGYKSTYMHLSKRIVNVGDTVVKGQLLGLMGTTGRSTGVHLHIEIKYNGVYIDPLELYK